MTPNSYNFYRPPSSIIDNITENSILKTGSFSGFRAIKEELGSGYLTAERTRQQPLCGNKEGWGPLSPYRYDFTPCFMDVWVSSVAVFGILAGAIAIWWLVKRKTQAQVDKNWHFWTKQVLIVAIAASVAVQLAIQIISYPGVWAGDFRFWTSILLILSLGVVFSIQWLEHTRLRNPNGVVLFYWLFLLIAYAVKLRSLISQQIYHEYLPYFVAYCVGFGLSIVEFGLEWLVPKKKSAYHTLEDEDESPIEYATVFSILTFGWMTPMMKYGYKKYLTEDDLWNLAKRDTTKATSAVFEEAWEYELEHRKKPSLWLAIFSSFKGPYLRGTLFKICSDSVAFIQPQLLRLLIEWVKTYKTDKPDPVIRGAAIALAMFAVSVTQTIALNQYFQRAFETGMRIKTALTAAIYQKSLKLSNEGRVSKSTGDIVNYMAVDTQRLQDITQYGQQLWSAPYQIILCMLSLYQLVGLSMLAGVGAMILMVPINALIARLMKTLQKEQMKNKDSRTRLIAEIVNNMKSIKLYAWGSAFMSKLNYVRNDQELKTLRKIGAAQAGANFTWSTTPFLVSCSTFAVFVLTTDAPLTTDIVFPTLSLLNLLTFPLAILPMVITSIIEASVAVNRLTSFLTAEELQPDALIVKGAIEEDGEESLSIRDGTFSWDRHADRNVLEDINFTANKGELTCIVGRVGAGKSSFLQVLLGDLWKVKGQVIVHGQTAYVAQQPWIMNASVKENILFGHRYDPNFYEKTVKACALTEDFAQLPDGDETEVGERGISLSGGQKARLTLARAVYARADVYLLDDCLSAVDQHVGRHLIENNRDTSAESEATSDSSTILDYERPEEDEEKDEMEEAQEHLTQLQPIRPGGTGVKRRKGSSGTLRRASTASFRGPRGKLRDEEEPSKTRQGKEHSEQGKVKWSVYAEYAKTSNLVAVLIYLGGNVWLKDWADINDKAGINTDVGKFLGVYFAFGIGSAALVVIQTLILWIFCSIEVGIPDGKDGFSHDADAATEANIVLVQASRKLHERMAFAIFRSPMSFFETTPAGRILNRFSSARALFTLGVISSAVPAFIALIVPLSGVYYWVQRYYLRTSRELKRLDSVSRSPIYAHFQESLGGVGTIRAYRQQQRFTKENEWRVDANLRAYFPSINSNRWLAVRLEFLGSIIILSAAAFVILSISTGTHLSPGYVGLVMSYALQITQSLNWIVRQTVEVETNIVSVERVLEYARLPSEAPEVIHRNRPPISWPASGGVQFNNYSTRYREGLDLVLKNINLDIKPHEKIGVVGRTGAGKSSLTLALFRIIEPSEGNISIDALNTSTIGLLDLRRRLAIIPQDAALFEGTIRDNLDPGHVHDDTELWSVLEHARLKDHVSTMNGGLEAKIQEGGSNLSQGQRQLVSLARALLTPSNILVLDEATAAVDVETDALLQNTLRSPLFSKRTIITIAHRINTILDSDRIVVLEHGVVKEFDTPRKLMDERGLFWKLVREAGLEGMVR
ncbi:abc metal ion transporter protein [Rutstroemia sp. NJR-2017a BVV2]|nr:abc metal ion transporter protein [Rutstroemia sp. NJR-2017a BVV2]